MICIDIKYPIAEKNRIKEHNLVIIETWVLGPELLITKFYLPWSI